MSSLPAKENKHPHAGRPIEYNRQEIMQRICQQVSKGKAVATILEEEEGMPTYSALHLWMKEDAELFEQYTRAREDSADFLADEIVRISDTEPDANRARVRVDARKWVASKLKPKRYGDRVTQEFTGADGANLFAGINIVLVQANSIPQQITDGFTGTTIEAESEVT